MESIGVDARHYSGISMRREGITPAVQAGVSEPILYLQSGHGTARLGAGMWTRWTRASSTRRVGQIWAKARGEHGAQGRDMVG